jgi:hypothetical protein
MKPFLILTLLAICSKTIACELVPIKVMHLLESEKPEWIQLAPALQPITDASPTESLESSIGDAML